MDTIEEIEVTESTIREHQLKLAESKGLTVKEIYACLDRGDYQGTILASKLHSLRFLLGDD
jgi:predicted transcriptional regulator